MNTLNGYSKNTLTDLYALTASGGHFPIHEGRNNEKNKLVRTDTSGYILAGWINTTSGDMGTTDINKIYCSNDNYIRYKTPANFFSTLANDSDLLSITVGSLNRKLTVAYASNALTATYLNIQYCRDDSSPYNKGLWNTIKNGTTDAISNRVRFYTIYNTTTDLGAPVNGHGELLEICSYNANYWQPLLWFGSGKDGRLYYRNKNYSNDSWGTWRTVAWTSDIPIVTNYYWANVKISSSSNVATNPTFAIATATTSVTTPLVSSTEHLTLNATSISLELKFNNDSTKSVVLNGAEFKPFDAANGKLDLGASDARWSNVYSILGNFTGVITSSLTTRTHINGNKGTAIINSTAAAGYNMLAKMNSTNGVFNIGTYNTSFDLYYTTKTVIDASTNSTTYGVTLLNELGNSSFPGQTSVNTLKITNTSAVEHITFSRSNYNYIVAPAGGYIGFCVNGGTIGSANCEMAISDGTIFPGTTNVTSLGDTSHYWTGVYAHGFYKNGSSNNYALTGGGGHMAIHTGRNNEANKLIRTDSNGYLQTGLINTTSGNMNTTAINKIYCSNDDYIRYKTPANFFETLANDDNQISITVGSQNRKLTVNYASFTKTLDNIGLPSSTLNEINTAWCKFARITFNNSAWSTASGYLFFGGGENPDNRGILVYHFRSGSTATTLSAASLHWLVKSYSNATVIAVKVADNVYDLYTNNLGVYMCPRIYHMSAFSSRFAWSVGSWTTTKPTAAYTSSDLGRVYYASNAGSADAASKVYINNSSNNSTYPVIFTNTASCGTPRNDNLYVDTISGAGYNPSNNSFVASIMTAGVHNSTSTLYLDSGTAATSIIFRIGGIEKVRIALPNGYLGINTTTITYPLTVNGTAQVSLLRVPIANQYREAGSIILNNSDIWGLNAIYTLDLADSAIEGYLFKRTNGNYDSIWCKDGTFYFSPNGNSTDGYGNNYTIYHSGNLTKSTIGLDNVQNTAFYKRSTSVNGTDWNMAGTVDGAAFTIYAPTTVGTSDQLLKSNGSGAPTWVNLNTITSGYTNYLKVLDIRDTNHLPNSTTYPEKNITAWFNLVGTPNGSWWSGITVKGWDNTYAVWQLCSYSSIGTANDYNLYFRNGINTTWGSWKTIITSGNYTSYTVKKDGTGATGTWGISISGNAATATKLTTSAGSATLPIYFSDGKPVACTASSVFSNLSNDGNNLSITIAGLNRKLIVNYASNAEKVAVTDSSTAHKILSATGSGSLSIYRLTSTIGGTTKPIYINAGVPTAFSSTIGNSKQPVYLSNGTITLSDYSFYGSSTLPIVLVAGYIYRSSATAASNNWYFSGYKHESVGDLSLTATISGGVAKFSFSAASGKSVFFIGSIVNHRTSAECTYSESGDYDNIRADGLYWFGTHTSSTNIYVRACCTADDNNDSTQSRAGAWKDWSGAVLSFSIIVVGYAT